MKKTVLRTILVGALLLFGGVAAAKGSPDYRAGYNDGCSSGKGHYTRSAYKYRHSSVYHRGWLKGKRACIKQHKARHKTRHKSRRSVGKCSTEAPWVAFQRGWNAGYRSAKGHRVSDRRGCAAYRHGWVSGYRSCKCASHRRADSYVEGYNSGCMSSAGRAMIRNSGYYETSPEYRRGWDLGYKDCPHEE